MPLGQTLLPMLLLTTSSALVCATSEQPMVSIGNTQVRGTMSALRDGVEQFLGLPFAVAPTPENDLRFRPTTLQDIDTDVAELNATQYGAACLQVEVRPCPPPSSSV
jgi:hypothetical protein